MNLEEEIIDGYLVSAKMKRVWSLELDLFNKFVSVCEKYGLKYYVMFGTLLGAVRHKGFIPWDDDIDVCMMRDDYDKLRKIGPASFEAPYFFQTTATEKEGFFRTHVQIRNSNTTAAIVGDDGTYNCGIFLDVFVLDEVPSNRIKFHRNLLKYTTKIYSSGVKKRPQGISAVMKWMVKKMIYKLFYGGSPLIVYEKFQKRSAMFKGKNCDMLAHTEIKYADGEVWEKKNFEKTVLLDFESVKVCAPSGYDEVLRHKYGDYMIIPENKGGTCHGKVTFETDIPYKKFFNKG